MIVAASPEGAGGLRFWLCVACTAHRRFGTSLAQHGILLMVELEEKAKRLEDITGDPVKDGHYKSVITGIILVKNDKSRTTLKGNVLVCI